MEQAKQVADGFRAMANALCILVTFEWICSWNIPALVGVPLLFVLAASFVAYCIKLFGRVSKNNTPKDQVRRAKAILMGTVGVGIACWLGDVLSTIIAVNIGTSQELNPLWPYSAFIALAYYIPIAFGMYYLLFKQKTRGSFYAALIISIGTLLFATLSFTASMNNFAYRLQTIAPSANLIIICIWSVMLLVLTGFNVATVKGKLTR